MKTHAPVVYTRRVASYEARLRSKEVGLPDPCGGGCWALVRAHTGSMIPAFVSCGKKPRPDHLTCHWHRDREEAAQQRAQDASR